MLKQGEVVVVPTETVYGLAARINDEKAIAKVFELKGRPLSNPLIVHVCSLAQANEVVASFSDDELHLINKFWPGPLTIVCKAKPSVSELITAGHPTVAIRMPNDPAFLALLEKNGPMVAPSANRSGLPSPTSPEHVREDHGVHIPILDGGETKHGIESTIVSVKDGVCTILRPGAIPKEALSQYVDVSGNEDIVTPGQRFRHYAPNTPLVPYDGSRVSCIVGYEDRVYNADIVIRCGLSKDPESIARKLYHALREIDTKHVSCAAIDCELPSSGLYTAIRERIMKAVSDTHLVAASLQ